MLKKCHSNKYLIANNNIALFVFQNHQTKLYSLTVDKKPQKYYLCSSM